MFNIISEKKKNEINNYSEKKSNSIIKKLKKSFNNYEKHYWNIIIKHVENISPNRYFNDNNQFNINLNYHFSILRSTLNLSENSEQIFDKVFIKTLNFINLKTDENPEYFYHNMIVNNFIIFLINKEKFKEIDKISDIFENSCNSLKIKIHICLIL